MACLLSGDAITRANVDPNQCRDMASLNYNELAGFSKVRKVNPLISDGAYLCQYAASSLIQGMD